MDTKLNQITLHFNTCPRCGDLGQRLEQSLADALVVGPLICERCGDELPVEDKVTVKEK